MTERIRELEADVLRLTQEAADLTTDIQQLDREAEYLVQTRDEARLERDLAKDEVLRLTRAQEALQQLLAGVRPYVEAHCGSKGMTRGMAEQDLERIVAALTAPSEAASSPKIPVYGSEVLCDQCALVFCPFGEHLHFHHDGCPWCSMGEAASSPQGKS